MKEQILKLAKRLNSFSLDDIQVMTGYEEKEILECLEEFIERNQIKRNFKNSYTFIKLQYVAKLDVYDYKPKGVILTEEDIKAYNNADKSAKKFADKYLMLIEGSNGLRGKPLQKFIDEWNLKNPTMKTSAPRVHIARKKLLNEGVKGLLGKNMKTLKDRKMVYEPIYIYFRELYLSPQMLTSMQALDLAVNKYMEENPKFDKSTLAQPQTYRRRLYSEYTIEELNFHRSNYLTRELSVNLKLNTIHFYQAAQEFLDTQAREKCKGSTIEGYKNYLKVHLLPYFKNNKLSEITDEKIKEFKEEKFNQGLAAKSVNNLLTLLTSIIRIYDDNYSVNKVFMEKEDVSLNILNENQVKTLLSNAKQKDLEIYYILSTALFTGMTRSEILGLTWDKIDWKNKQIEIDRSLCKGKLIPHKNNNSRRVIDVSENFLNTLKEMKPKLKKYTDIFVFKNSENKPIDPDNLAKRKLEPFIKSLNYQNITFIDLRDTYAALLIKQNLPLTYVQQQLGHSSVNVTAERYKNIIPDVKIGCLNLI